MMTGIIRGICIALMRVYRYCLSPLLPNVCRYGPSCSEYAVIAFETHPPLRAAQLVLRRLSRCHPWGGHGFDPVPLPNAPALPPATIFSTKLSEPPALLPREKRRAVN